MPHDTRTAISAIGCGRRLSHTLLRAGAVLLLAGGAPAWALTITPTFDATITADPNATAIEATINTAIATYQTDFSDPITVPIGFGEMSSGLGQNSTYYTTVSWSTYLTALQADAKTASDATALAQLPTGSTNPVTGTAAIAVKYADLHAVGINLNPPAGQPYGTIGLNTAITFYPGGPSSSGSNYSLLTTTEHEIDEVLGLGSALPSPTADDPFPEDLFRYNASGNRSFTTTATATSYFSINGSTLLAQFDNQNDGGDFGDWQSNPLPGGVLPKVQDAFATAGATATLGLGSPELTALDVIGYDLITGAAPVPEPGTLALLGTAIAGIAALRRRRSKGFVATS